MRNQTDSLRRDLNLLILQGVVLSHAHSGCLRAPTVLGCRHYAGVTHRRLYHRECSGRPAAMKRLAAGRTTYRCRSLSSDKNSVFNQESSVKPTSTSTFSTELDILNLSFSSSFPKHLCRKKTHTRETRHAKTRSLMTLYRFPTWAINTVQRWNKLFVLAIGYKRLLVSGRSVINPITESLCHVPCRLKDVAGLPSAQLRLCTAPSRANRTW